MEFVATWLPWLSAMAVLIGCSAFFSGSEAALFSLPEHQRKLFASGTASQRLVVQLLSSPDRLLSAVLFWNLVVNIAYFAIASRLGLAMQGTLFGVSKSVVFAGGALLTIIFFSEMVPKSIGVIGSPQISALVARPLDLALRIVAPVMPLLRATQLVSRRIIWPMFTPEPTLQVADLERAIDMSTAEANLGEQEQAALRNIVMLSDIRVDEWMRPRTQYRAFSPPVSRSDLAGKMTPSGYLLVTDNDSDDIRSAIDLRRLSNLPENHLEHYAKKVSIVPWCATVADTLQQMREQDRQVAAVVNEYGETVGILTYFDILDTLFNYNPSRSERLINRAPIQESSPGVWHVVGMTSAKRLCRFFQVKMPESKSVTIAGIVQEQLQRVLEPGDTCNWGPFKITVKEVPAVGNTLLELTLLSKPEDS